MACTVLTSLHREGHRRCTNCCMVVGTLYIIITTPRSRYTCSIDPHPPRPHVPVKVDINKTYLSTGKTRCSKQTWTQPRLQIKLPKIPTTKGHQVLLLTTMLKYHKVNQKVTTNNFVLYLFFFLEMGPRLIFLDCRVSYSLTHNDNTDKHRTYQRL